MFGLSKIWAGIRWSETTYWHLALANFSFLTYINTLSVLPLHSFCIVLSLISLLTQGWLHSSFPDAGRIRWTTCWQAIDQWIRLADCNGGLFECFPVRIRHGRGVCGNAVDSWWTASHLHRTGIGWKCSLTGYSGTRRSLPNLNFTS